MEIRFCHRCSESIPEGDFEAGRAVTVSGRHYHANCALARSLSNGGPRAWLTFLLALYAAGIGTWLLVSTLSKDEAPKVNAEVKQAIASSVAEADGGTRAALKSALETLRTEIAAQTGAASQDVRADLGQRLEVLTGRLEEMDGLVAGYLTGQKRRLESAEKEIAALNHLLREVKEQADRIEAQRAAEAARPRPEPAQPAVQPKPEPEVTPPQNDPARDPAVVEEVQRWIRRLGDANENIRFSATLELGRLKSLLAVKPLLKVLKDDRDYYVRLGAATALGDIRAVDAVLPLVDALEDDDALVRTAANDALQAISEQPFEFVPGMTRGERRKLQKRWRTWFKDSESGLREKLGQPKAP